MEEKNKTKLVSINSNAKPAQKEEKKATYEELNNYCMQLFNQNKQLMAQLQEKEMFSLFKRLDYLFLVLKNKECFSSDFVGDCVLEITTALSVPEDDNEKTSDKEEKKGE